MSNLKGRRIQTLDGGWGWAIVIGSFVVCAAFGGMIRSQGIVMQALITYYGASTSEVSLVTMTSSLAFTLASLVGTTLGEFYTVRRVVTISGLIGTTWVALATLGFNVPYIACTFGIGLGLGNGLMYGNCLAIIGKYFRQKRALANSLALSGASVGQMVLPPLINMAIEQFTVKGAFLILAGIYAQTIAVGALYRPIAVQLTPEASLEILVEEPHRDGSDDDESLDDDAQSEWSHCKYTDILKNKIQREESRLSHVSLASGSTASKIFFPFANSEMGMSASLANLQQISHQVDIAISLVSITSPEQSRTCCSTWHRCPKIIDFSVLKNIKCMFFCLTGTLLFFSGFNFFLFLPSIVAERGVSDKNASLLISIVGASDLIGRLGCGLLANFGFCQRYKISAGCGLILGVNMLVFTFFSRVYWQMALQSGINGLAFGGYITLMSVVLIDCLGLELLPRVLSLVLFCNGLGPCVGQIVLGWVRDQTGDFTIVLIILGVTGILGGTWLFMYPFADRLEKRRVANKNNNNKKDTER